MKIRTALLLVPVLLAFCPGIASAGDTGSDGGLDLNFGDSGIVRISVPEGEFGVEGFTVSPDGRIYVLYESLLLALESDGEVAQDFGEDGQVSVEPAVGESQSPLLSLVEEENVGGPSGLAVDSEGRLLVVGSTYLPSRKADEAYVTRLLPDGSYDDSFGGDGEVETDFDLAGVRGHARPNVRATSIALDTRDRPIIGGSFGNPSEPCAVNPGHGPEPFFGRLGSDGAIDKTFARSGRAILKRRGKVISVVMNPTGGAAVFSRDCPEGARIETLPPRLSLFTEGGRAKPIATERRLPFTYSALSIDSRGRILELESPPEVAEGRSALVRFLANGDRDQSFGRGGKVFARPFAPFAVDAENRLVVAGGPENIALRRFLPDGRTDPKFGPGGRLVAKGDRPIAIALDASGRIYTLGLAESASGTTLQIARFIPGS